MPMRIVLVGPAADRERLREELAEAGVQIVDEAPTLAAARASAAAADAYVLALPDRARSSTTGGGAPPVDDAAPGDPVPVEPLTAREREVMALLALGLSNRAIAERLGISDQTAKFHVASIIGKLGAANRTDAVRRAARRGLIDL